LVAHARGFVAPERGQSSRCVQDTLSRGADPPPVPWTEASAAYEGAASTTQPVRCTSWVQASPWFLAQCARLSPSGMRPAKPAARPPLAQLMLVGCHQKIGPTPSRSCVRRTHPAIVELLLLRYARMSESPFSSLRGAALLMARDLSTTPTTGLQVQASGDPHLANFGAYGTPERQFVFDIAASSNGSCSGPANHAGSPIMLGPVAARRAYSAPASRHRRYPRAACPRAPSRPDCGPHRAM